MILDIARQHGIICQLEFNMAVAEAPRFVNPYEIIRPHFSEGRRLMLGKTHRLIIDNNAIVGFGHADNKKGVILFATTLTDFPIITEYRLMTGGSLDLSKPDLDIATLDLYIRPPEKIFLGEKREYEVRTSGKDAVSLCVQVLCTHEFKLDPLFVGPNSDCNSYLRAIRNT